MTIFEGALERYIDMNYELVLLSKGIEWEAKENPIEGGYYDNKHI